MHTLLFIYLFIYLFKINDRRTRGPLILPEVHKNTQNTQHKLNKGKKEKQNKTQIMVLCRNTKSKLLLNRELRL